MGYLGIITWRLFQRCPKGSYSGRRRKGGQGNLSGTLPSSVALMIEGEERESQQGAGEGKEYGSPGTVIGNQHGYQ